MLIHNIIESGMNLALMILNEFLSVLNFSVFISNLEVLSKTFFDILSYVYFFLPVPYLLPLISIVFFVIFAKITMSLVRFIIEIWQSVPFV